MSIQDPSPAGEQLIRFPLAVPAPLWRRGTLPVVVGALLGFLALVTVTGNLLDGNLLVSVAVAMFFGPLVCVALGAAGRAQPAVGSLRLVSTAEGWRQVAGVRPQRLVTVVGVAWLALGLVGAAAYGVGRLFGLVEPPSGAQTSTAGVVVAVLLALAFAGALALLAVSMVKLRRGAGDDGSSTIGIGLSPWGVHIDLPGSRRGLGWHEITAISPEVMPIGRAPVFAPGAFNRREQVPMVRIRASESAGDQLVIPLSQLNVSPDVMWTALTWYGHHDEARWELERAEGTARLARWQQQAAQVPRP